MPNNLILQTALRNLMKAIESEAAEEFLKMLLKAMQVAFALDGDYRKNIKDFKGKYFFRNRDGQITVSAIFAKGRMRVREELLHDPNITVTFADGKALINFLLTPKPDILGSMLRQEVVLNGNLNYLYKLAFMAKRLQLKALGSI